MEQLSRSYLVNPITTISNALYSGGIKEYGSLRNIIVQKIDGKVINFDLYDLLIRGNRKNDIVLSPGDTVIIEGTTNHVKIDGAVIRPMVYEYSEKDSIEDLIQFALSLLKMLIKKILRLSAMTEFFRARRLKRRKWK